MQKQDQKFEDFSCRKCLQNQSISKKYLRLIDLLKLKINQLQKKINKSQLSQGQEVMISSISLSTSHHYHSLQSYDLVIKPWQNDQERQSKKSLNFSLTAQPIFNKAHQQTFLQQQTSYFEKVDQIIKKLTQEIIQLKSNSMHIRHCLYTLFKEIKLQKQIGNHVIFNIFLAISNIYQFSEEERSQIFHVKKIKFRKRQKVGKQNIFKTITEL